MKFTQICLAAILIFSFIGTAYGLCDSGKAQKCGDEFYTCTYNYTELAKPGNADSSVMDPVCSCYDAQARCLDKAGCFTDGPYYMHHYPCIALGCSEAVCGAASTIKLSAAALFVALALLL